MPAGRPKVLTQNQISQNRKNKNNEYTNEIVLVTKIRRLYEYKNKFLTKSYIRKPRKTLEEVEDELVHYLDLLKCLRESKRPYNKKGVVLDEQG